MQEKNAGNGRHQTSPITVGDFIQKHSVEHLLLFTPNGLVKIAPEQREKLLAGKVVVSSEYADSEYEVCIKAGELLNLVVVNDKKIADIWYLLTDRPGPKPLKRDQGVELC